MSKKDNIFDISYILHLLSRYWVMLLSMVALGATIAFCYNEFSIPLFKSKISIFTWNQSVTEALKNIKQNRKDKKTDKVQEIMMYNNIVSQSIYLGQRLISDYINIMNNPQVKKAADKDLIRQGFKAPLRYTFECSVKRKSCIMSIAVVSPDSKLATAAANSLIKAFQNEQQRLMDIKYAKTMHPATIAASPFRPRKKLIYS